MSVLLGACNMLLAVLWDFVEVLFVVLGKLDTAQLAGTGAKKITLLIGKLSLQMII